jgi:hypothetical protein
MPDEKSPPYTPRGAAPHRIRLARVREKKLESEQAREERVEQAAQPLAEAFAEVAATAHTGKRLPPGWAKARLAQVALVAIAAGDIDAMRNLARDLHALNAELPPPLSDDDLERLVRAVVEAGPEVVREAMRRCGIEEKGNG